MWDENSIPIELSIATGLLSKHARGLPDKSVDSHSITIGNDGAGGCRPVMGMCLLYESSTKGVPHGFGEASGIPGIRVSVEYEPSVFDDTRYPNLAVCIRNLRPLLSG